MNFYSLNIIVKTITVLISLIILQSCMSPQEAARYYDSQSAKKICTSYYALPDYNINQGYREDSIQRRGIDCSPYVAAGLRKKRLNQALINMGTAMSQQPTYSNTTNLSTNVGFTKVCYYSGASGPSALTVRSTAICPITHTHNVTGLTKVCTYNNEVGGPKAITVRSTAICPIRYPR